MAEHNEAILEGKVHESNEMFTLALEAKGS
jgi:hypothetical protein